MPGEPASVSAPVSLRVAVIGCGLIGAAMARELQLRGARTIVYDALAPGRGTSGTTFAWVNSHDKEPLAYHELNVDGMRAHHELQARDAAAGARWFFPTGNLEWAGEAGAGEARAARLEALGYPLRRLTAQEARELEPDVLVPAHAGGLLFFPSEGYVLPANLLDRLLREARDLGAELRCGARVEAITPHTAGVRLHLAGGPSDLVDTVVSCVGRWTAGLMETAGNPVPMADPEAPGSAAVGYLAYTRPTAVRLSRVLHTPRLNVRPDGGGRLVLQALDCDLSADPATAIAVDGPLAGDFVSRAGEVLDGAPVEIEAIRVGQRAIPADGLTVAGHMDESERLYVIATHSGVTLALHLARLAAEEIVAGSRAEALAPFRPQRFSA